MSELVVNSRILNYRLTGVQRYLHELLARWDGIQEIRPLDKTMAGIKAHLWEQLVLPGACRNKLLFSPSNSGPIFKNNQVVTIHDVVPLDHPEWLNKRFAAWYRFMLPKLISNCRGVVAISNYTKSRILDCVDVDPDKICVVPNGVDSRFFPANQLEIERVRKKYNFPDGRYFLSLSSLEPRKNLSNLIKAWESVAPSLPDDVFLVLAGGKGALHIFANDNISTEGRDIFWPGYIDDNDIVGLYSGSHAFVYPSYYEGFGLPPLEAMACGAITIVGNKTAIPEVVGDAAVKIDPYSVSELAEIISDVANCPERYDSLRAAAVKRASGFSWDTTADLTYKYLESFG